MISSLHRIGSCGRAALALAVLGSALCLGGCFGYNNVEPIEGATGFENPNSPPVPQAMATALQWVTLRYPPGGDRLSVGATSADRPAIAVNFPVGTRRDTCEYVCRNTGPWAQPLTTENDGLPIYHIARVWTRGLYATVDIYRPASQLGPPGSEAGGVLYQCITVQLRSGIGSYSVFTHRVWPVGSFEVPGLHYLSPGHLGRAQPAPNEQAGKLPPLPGEQRTRATGGEPAIMPGEFVLPPPADEPSQAPAPPEGDPVSPPGAAPSSTGTPPGLQPPRSPAPADDTQGSWPRT